MQTKLKIAPIEGSFSLKEHIYEVLKDAITRMNIYDEGADLRLDERQLSEQLRISRTPIREAIARLEQEGLVTVIPRRGVYITKKTKKEILEMITVWAALESMAARLITESASDEKIASLRELFTTFEDGQVQAHIDEYSDRMGFSTEQQAFFYATHWGLTGDKGKRWELVIRNLKGKKLRGAVVFSGAKQDLE